MASNSNCYSIKVYGKFDNPWKAVNKGHKGSKQVRFNKNVEIFLVNEEKFWKPLREIHQLRGEGDQHKKLENVTRTYRKHLAKIKEVRKA